MGRSNRSNHIYDWLKEAITLGKYQVGSLLPKELELAARLQVSRGTVRVALDQLESEQLIERIKRRGTIVRPAPGKIHKLLIIDDTATTGLDAVNPSILPGIQYECMRRNIKGIQIEYEYISGQPQEQAVRSIRESNVSGIIVLANNYHGTEPIVPILKQTGLPVLLPHGCLNDLNNTGFDMVMYTDHRQNLQMGLRYLTGLGHRRIAFVGNLSWRNYRNEAEYFSDLAQMGADTDRSLLWGAATYDQAQKTLEETIKRFFQMPSPPTALYCASDRFAFMVYQVLYKLKIRIPERVSVLSMGGNIGGDYMSPQLTVVDYQYYDIGRMAVEKIMALIEGEASPSKLVVTPSEMTIRQSCRNILPQNQENKPKQELILK